MTCDAAMAPIVTGEVNPAALDDLVCLCVDLDRLGYRGAGGGTSTPAPDTTRAWEAFEQAIIGRTIIFLPHSCRRSYLPRRQSSVGARTAILDRARTPGSRLAMRAWPG
jgi:hypothetical protein